jgi:hypothetical protein
VALNHEWNALKSRGRHSAMGQTQKMVFSMGFEKIERKAIQLTELTFAIIARGNLQFQLLAVGSIHSFLAIKQN